MVEETLGGTGGDFLSTFLVPGIGLTVLASLVVAFSIFLKADANDFRQAKKNEKKIMCKSFTSTFTIPHDRYTVSGNRIIFERFGLNKKFLIPDCKIL